MSDAAIALAQFRQVVGVEHAIPWNDERAAGLRASLVGEANDKFAPLAVVKPASIEQLQSLVRMAGTLGVSIATTPNATTNGAILGTTNKPSMLLNLERMRRIVEFNGESGCALVEPGVSFSQLRAQLQAQGEAYWIDPDPNGANSISGSITQRSFGYTPYGDHLLMQCGMEVMCANGDIVRTGMGALPGSDTWQLFKYNFGPYLDGLFSQSDLAIVTKMGLWLMPAPPAYFPFAVSLASADAAANAVEILRPLKIQMIVPNTVVVAHAKADASLVRSATGANTHAAEGDNWRVYGALYGIEENVHITWEMVHAALMQIPSAEIFTDENPPANPAWQLRRQLMAGEPAYESMPVGNARTVWFDVAAPMEAEAASAMLAATNEVLADFTGELSYEFVLSWRTMFFRISLLYTSERFAETLEIALKLIQRLHDSGYSVSHNCRLLEQGIDQIQTDPSDAHLRSSLARALDPGGVFARR